MFICFWGDAAEVTRHCIHVSIAIEVVEVIAILIIVDRRYVSMNKSESLVEI